MTKQEISKLLYRHDPQGLAKMGAPADEYDSEARMIHTYLRKRQQNADDPLTLTEIHAYVYLTFKEYFNTDDHDLAGPAELYFPAAKDIHGAMQ